MLTLTLLLFLQDPPHDLYPYGEVMAEAQHKVALGRSLFSDYPDLYPLRWSATLIPPCREGLVGPGDDNPWLAPCSSVPFVPDPTGPQLPSVLLLSYQELKYQAPTDPALPKTQLALSWRTILISAGILWETTVTAEGIAHDLLFCEYERYDETILIGLIPLRVKMLRPKRYHHVAVRPNGSYTIQTHRIQQWLSVLSGAAMGLIYEVLPQRPNCGVPAFRYTTKPGEILAEVFGQFAKDVAEVLPGDRQIYLTPALGFKDCGEYPYALFYQFMLHRSPPSPSIVSDGPPLEIWSFTAPDRDIGLETGQVTQSEEPIDHSKVAAVRNQLRDLGFQGPFTPDEDLDEALQAQKVAEAGRYKRGAHRGDLALDHIERLFANPRDDELWEVFKTFYQHDLDQVDHLEDTEIEFNLLIHCTRPFGLGVSPLLGRHFWTDAGGASPDPCWFCPYHDRIVARPFQSWAHTRLTGVKWFWDPIHGANGNLYERAHGFIQRVIHPYPTLPVTRETLTDLQNRVGTRTAARTAPETKPVQLGDLEGIPSDTTLNSSVSAKQSNLPALFEQEFDPCRDPSYTIEYLFLYGEIVDVLDSPCGLLWAVAF